MNIDLGQPPTSTIPPRPCYGTAWVGKHRPCRVMRDKEGKDTVFMDGAWRPLTIGTLVVWEY